MVAAGEEGDAGELDQSVVERGDGFHVQMVGGLVEHQAVRAGDHHLGKQASHLFSSGKDAHLLHAVLTREQHSSQEAAHIGDVLHRGVAHQPVRDGQIIVELLRVVLGEVSLGGGHTPFIGAFIRLHLAHEDLEEGGFRQLVSAHEGDLVVVSHDEGDVVQNLFSIDGLGNAFHGEHLISDFPVGAEIDVGILSAGGTDFVQLDLFQGTLSGGRLLGLGGVGGETGDEFLQLLDLFLLLLVRFLHLLDEQLAGLIPEIVVTGIQLNLAIIDVRDLGADLIQEITVMGNHDYRIFKFNEEILQPCDGVQIQVVGGLI